MLISSFFIFLFLTSACAAPSEDLVAELPEYGIPPSPMYSGFLNCSAANPEADVQLHYWYTQSTAPIANASDLPLVLWLNGGPGSSSVLGLMEEWGPIIMNETGGISENPYSWSQLVNVVLLESPAGVGYSYCAQSLTTGCNNTDVSTATTARVAMQEFFKKFPELADNDFFITGESYAGVYVPTLAKEILDNAPEINLKGVGVGDPCTDNAAQKDSMDMVWYGYKNGFIAPDVYDLLWNKCGFRHPVERMGLGAMTMKVKSTECTVAKRKYLTSTSKGFSQEWLLDFINNLSLFSPSAVVSFDQPGSLNYELAAWMMRADVRKALHVDVSPNTEWPGPGKHWKYRSQWSACNPFPEFKESMIDFYQYIGPRLAARGGQTIVFNGDTDPCVSYEGTRDAMAEVFPEIPGGAYRPWFYNQTAATYEFLDSKPVLFGPGLTLFNAGPQLGGLVVNYEHNVTFATVHGSGHMVPQFRPQASLQLLSSLINMQPLAELLPTDADLAAMSESQFSNFLDSYITDAKHAVEL